MDSLLILTILGFIFLLCVNIFGKKDHYVNDKGQKIALPRDKGVLYYYGECTTDRHYLPMYNNGYSVGIGESHERCQCGKTTVGQERYRVVADMMCTEIELKSKTFDE